MHYELILYLVYIYAFFVIRRHVFCCALIPVLVTDDEYMMLISSTCGHVIQEVAEGNAYACVNEKCYSIIIISDLKSWSMFLLDDDDDDDNIASSAGFIGSLGMWFNVKSVH